MSPGATEYQCHVHLAILRVLGPQLGTGATIWITYKWRLGWAIVDLLGPQWPRETYERLVDLDISSHYGSSVSSGRHYISTPCRSRHFMSSGSHWAVGASIGTKCLFSHSRSFCVPSEPPGHCISTSCTSCYFKSSGSPVSHRSHYMNHTLMACKLSHCGPSWSPMSTGSHYMNNL